MSEVDGPLELPRHLRVLILDDSEDDATLLERQLRQGGYDITTRRADNAADLRDALASAEWDLILSDFSMPGFNALDALAIVREHDRDLPVIVVSGSVGEDVAVQAMRAGAHDYFPKSELRRLVAAAERELREAARRRRAVAERHAVERRFETMANTAPVLIWMSGPDGARTWFNRPWLDFRGRSQEAELGQGWAAGIHPDDAERYLAEVRAAVAGREAYRTEYRLRSAAGEYAWMLESAMPLLGPGGAFVGHIASAVDITHEKHAHHAAEEASRLKDEFLATLSHELRTPLNAILGWAHLLQDPAIEETLRAKALRTIERNAELQAHLIADMLDVSRVVTGKLHLNVRSVDFCAVVDGVVEVMGPALEAKHLAVVRSYDPAAAGVTADAERLQQVVWNLLSNAVKFSPPSGQIRVALSLRDGETQLDVEDDGPGMPPAFLPFAFDRFRQADSSSTRRYGGLGLGLALVRHLVEAHGGQVTAANRADRPGAVVSVRLPRRPAVVAAASPAAEDDPTLLADYSVLLVEDDLDSLELLRLVLQRAGARVLTATSVRQAFETLRTARPDVLVSDIGLPGESGYDLIQQVRALPPNDGGLTPAAALTAFASAADRTRLLEAGFQRHLPKPVFPAHLLDAVAELAGARRPGRGQGAGGSTAGHGAR